MLMLGRLCGSWVGGGNADWAPAKCAIWVVPDAGGCGFVLVGIVGEVWGWGGSWLAAWGAAVGGSGKEERDGSRLLVAEWLDSVDLGAEGEGAAGLVGWLGVVVGGWSPCPSLVLFFFRNPRVGIKCGGYGMASCFFLNDDDVVRQWPS